MSPGIEKHTYIVMPDGSVRWEPGDTDIEAWLEEVRDIECSPDEWD